MNKNQSNKMRRFNIANLSPGERLYGRLDVRHIFLLDRFNHCLFHLGKCSDYIMRRISAVLLEYFEFKVKFTSSPRTGSSMSDLQQTNPISGNSWSIQKVFFSCHLLRAPSYTGA